MKNIIENLLKVFHTKVLLKDNFIYLFFATIAIAFLMFTPILNSGFAGDDSFDSLLKGKIALAHTNVLQYFMNVIKTWAVQQGRFYPFANLSAIILTLCSNVLLFKSIKVIFLLADIVTFYYFIRLFTNVKLLGIFSLLLMPILMQVRLSHDSILGFAVLLQLIILTVLLSLIFLIKYLKNEKTYFLGLSLGFHLMSMLTYEITYPFFLLHIIIIYIFSKKRKAFSFKLSSLFFATAVICMLMPVLIRIIFKIPLVGGASSGSYTPNLDIIKYLETLTKQTFASLPLNAFLIKFTISFGFKSFLVKIWDFHFMKLLLLALSYFTLFFIIIKKFLQEDFKSYKNLFWIGIPFCVLPGLLISLSPRYQTEITWSYGYLPVFISYFGIAMIIIGLIYVINSRFNSRNKTIIFSVFCSLMLSILGLFSYLNNEMVIEQSNLAFKYPRWFIEEGIHKGLFNKIPDHCVLLVDNENIWDQPAFYLMNSKVRFKYVGSGDRALIYGGKEYSASSLPEHSKISEVNGKYTYSFSDKDNIYYLKYDSDVSKHNKRGYIIFGKLKYLTFRKNNILVAITDKANVFILTEKSNDFNDPQKISLSGYYVSPSSPIAVHPFNFIANLKEIHDWNNYKDWKRLTIKKHDNQIDMELLDINFGETPIISNINSSGIISKTGGTIDIADTETVNIYDRLHFTGWAYDPDKMKLAKGVVIVDNGKVLPALVKVHIYRWDIAAYFKKVDLIYTGWESFINARVLGAGNHVLQFYALLDDNKYAVLQYKGNNSVTIKITSL